jgi:hypothetical protein
MVGVLPLVGCAVMFGVFVKALIDYSKTGSGYSNPILGIQVPIVIGIGGLLLGVPLMVLCALKYRNFFSRKLEVAPEGILDAPAEPIVSHF